MEKQKNNKGVIALLIVIIIILGVLCVLFATDTISFNFGKVDNDDNSTENVNEDGENNFDVKVEYSREEIVLKLKNALSDKEWVKNNLYSGENVFGDEVLTDNQELTFLVLADEKNNPVIIVRNYSQDDFLNICYKVYFDGDEVLVKNIIGRLAHPSHEEFSVDMEKGLVISTYMHMGSHIVTSYDVKMDEIEEKELYSCTTGKCDYSYEYEGNLTYILTELNNTNINEYIK